jgi:hypothetical protein
MIDDLLLMPSESKSAAVVMKPETVFILLKAL